jgi:hypothetical protein
MASGDHHLKNYLYSERYERRRVISFLLVIRFGPLFFFASLNDT